MSELEEFVRRLRALPHLRAHPVDPADQLQVELGVAAEMVINARTPLQQTGQDVVEIGDRIGIVHAEGVDRAFRPGARAVPGFLVGIAFATEQQALAMLAARNQHQHRLRLGKAAEVPEVAVLPIGIVRVLAADALGRRRQDQDGVVVGHAHELLASPGEFGGLDHGASVQGTAMTRPEHAVAVEQQGRHAHEFGHFLQRFLVAVGIVVAQFAGRDT